MNHLPIIHEHASSLISQDSHAEFQRFLNKIHQAPILEADEEQQLAIRLQTHNDVNAAHKLVLSHMRLVVKIAREYLGYRLALPDLVQEGTLGLMQAVKRFDPFRGTRLATYAIWWIRATLHDFILRTWSLVRIGTTQIKRKLFYKLRQTKNTTAQLSQTEAESLAQQFGTDAATILEMDGRLSGQDVSLNQLVVEDGGEMIDLIPDDRPNQEYQVLSSEQQHLLQSLVRQGLATLDPRERQIITARHINETPATLETLGQTFSISRERVRQLETRALNKLRIFFQNARTGQELACEL
jgi:RNA polymerase sigma-32 factor